jgi:hypothetical protein
MLFSDQWAVIDNRWERQNVELLKIRMLFKYMNAAFCR